MRVRGKLSLEWRAVKVLVLCSKLLELPKLKQTNKRHVPSISQIQRAGTGAFGTIRLLKGASLANLFTLLGGRVRYGVVTLK